MTAMHYSLYINICFTKVPTERIQTRLEENNTQSYESTQYTPIRKRLTPFGNQSTPFHTH